MAEFIKLNPDALTALRTIDPRLIKLAKELGTAWVRVSGTWANKTYYDFDGKLRSRKMLLNGKPLTLGDNDEMPQLSGICAEGMVSVAPGGCTFIVL